MKPSAALIPALGCMLIGLGCVGAFVPTSTMPFQPKPTLSHAENTPAVLLKETISPTTARSDRSSSSRLFMAKSTSPKAVLPSALRKTFVGLLQGVGAVFAFVRTNLSSLTAPQKLLMVAVFFAGFFAGRVKPFWLRFTDVMEIPSSYFGPNAPALTGRAVSVTDGDTIRLLHVPTPFHPKGVRKALKEKVSEIGLPIRICTIDTPETAKFGKPGQPFGQEAKEYLTKMLEGKTVNVRLLQKDQYGRAVGQVYVSEPPFGRKYVDEELLKQGLAEVYTGGGAVYGPRGLEAYQALESKAQGSKVGIWSQKNRESAAEFKKRTKS